MRLKILFPVILLMLVSFTNISAQKTQLNSPEIKEVLKKNPAIVILDVRTPQEFAAGHLKGAINIDIYKQNFYSEINLLDKKGIYVVYCRTHNRSGVTVDYMQKNGFKFVYQMMDGFPGWASNNFAYEKL